MVGAILIMFVAFVFLLFINRIGQNNDIRDYRQKRKW